MRSDSSADSFSPSPNTALRTDSRATSNGPHSGTSTITASMCPRTGSRPNFMSVHSIRQTSA